MNTTSKIRTAAASISMTVLALAAIAGAAQAQDVRIHVADLNLRSPEGRAQFDARVTAAATRECGAYLELSRRRNCVAAFREEADDNLSEQQERLAREQAMSLASARR